MIMNKEIEGIINYYIRINFIARTKVINYIRQLIIENQKLRNTMIHKHKYVSKIEDKYLLEKSEKDQLKSWLEEMLDDENDIFSVVRVKDVLFKLNELENNYECKRDV